MLQPIGLKMLGSLDPALRQRIEARGAPIGRLFGQSMRSIGRFTALDVSYGASAPGLGIHRFALHDELLRAVEAAQIPIESNFDVVERTQGGLRAADGREAPADVCVNALGAHSPLSPHTASDEMPCGAFWTNLVVDPSTTRFRLQQLNQRYRLASEMVGVLPLADAFRDGRFFVALFISAAAKDVPRIKHAGIDALKDWVTALWPLVGEELLPQVSSLDEFQWARYHHRTLPTLFSDGNVVHVGDAAKSTSPQLGQGVNMALVDAVSLARALEAAVDIPTAFAMHERARRRHIALYQRMSAIFTPFYQSDSRALPLVRDMGAHIAATLPPTAMLLRKIVDGDLIEPIRR